MDIERIFLGVSLLNNSNSITGSNGFSAIGSASRSDVTLNRRQSSENNLGYDPTSSFQLPGMRFPLNIQQNNSNSNMVSVGVINNGNLNFNQQQIHNQQQIQNQQQQLQQHQQSQLLGGLGSQMSSVTLSPMQSQLEFVIQNEDFPALPRATATQKPELSSELMSSSSFGIGLNNGNLLSSNGNVTSLSANSQQPESATTEPSLRNQVLHGFGGMIRSYLPNDSSFGILNNDTSSELISSTIPTTSALNSTISKPVQSSSQSNTVKYGLLGLLDAISMKDKDLNSLALGADLTSFGLNLNSTDCLYASFTSPFADHPTVTEPQFNTPHCYMMHPPTLKSENIAKFQNESLFYMFYMMPRDLMQVIAAQELYRRDWKYHSELRLWLKPRPPQDLLQSQARSDQNVPFMYFDVNSWEPRLFTMSYRGNILAGLLSEDDIRGRSANNNLQTNSVGPIGGGIVGNIDSGIGSNMGMNSGSSLTNSMGGNLNSMVNVNSMTSMGNINMTSLGNNNMSNMGNNNMINLGNNLGNMGSNVGSNIIGSNVVGSNVVGMGSMNI